MITIAAAALQAVISVAETDYPNECCGLLIGRHRDDGGIEIVRIETSENLAPDRRGERFEIDPAVRFRLIRDLAGGPEKIVGHYHSHPETPAKPSSTDIARAYEPDLVWMIVSVGAGHVVDVGVFRIDGTSVTPLRLTDHPLQSA